MKRICGPRRAIRKRLRSVFGQLLLVVGTALLVAVAYGADLVFGEAALAKVDAQYGPAARRRVEALNRMLATSRQQGEDEKLRRVNEFFNRIPFAPDQRQWGAVDYWATPIELLGVAGGDCEDYAIAKYFALRELGVADDKLRITYVRALELDQAHMVLAYYATPDAEALILDNLVNRIRPANERRDLLPVYSFNGTDLWLSKTRSRGQHAGSSNRIERWRALSDKMKNELKD